MSRNERAMKILRAKQRNERIREVRDGVDEMGVLKVETNDDYEYIGIGSTPLLPFLRKCKGFHLEVKIKVLELEEDWSQYILGN